MKITEKRALTFCFAAACLLLCACSGSISEEEAREIALSHAGLVEAEVTFIKCSLEKDDLREYYDVEFYVQDQQEYDYEIDSASGDILEWDVEPITGVTP